jgi:hypothetical protein
MFGAHFGPFIVSQDDAGCIVFTNIGGLHSGWFGMRKIRIEVGKDKAVIMKL